MLKKQIKTIAVCGILAGSIVFTGCSQKESAEVVVEKEVICIDTNNLDKSVKAGDNFFAYSNGGWMKTNPIPDDQTRWGSFNILQEELNTNLRELIENSAKEGGAKGTAKQQIGDFYKAGMDTATINQLGYKPIEADLALVNSISDKAGWLKSLYHFHATTVCPLFGLYSGQDDKNSSMVIAQLAQSGLGLGNRDYYFAKDKNTEEVRVNYVKHIENMFNLIKMDNSSAAAKKVMDFETKLAKISMTNVEQRDPFKVYNKMSIDELQKLSPIIDWVEYFKVIGIPTPKEINVTSVPFFRGLDKVINGTDIETLKNYLTWSVLNDAASLLSDNFVNEHFDFYGNKFSGQKKIDERWKRVTSMISGAMGEILGQIYVEKYFPPEAKQRALELINNLRTALESHIKNLDWMGEETKAKAIEKLHAITVKVGYPDKWKDYSKLEIVAGDFFQNCVNASIFNYKRELAEIDKPYDKAKWLMTPQTVNAYYQPPANEIVFPAGILQPPFFFKDGDDAVNYGAIGVVIGHEITHGFDDQGRNYDKVGNLSTWWTDEDSKKFEAKAKTFGEQYAKYFYPELENATINPALTMGENIADLGGVTISYEALQIALKAHPNAELIDGFTQQQRFFLAYSQVWRQNIRTERLAKALKDDPHSPGDARVNVIVPNIPAFYEAFGVKEGDKLYLPPDKRVVIW